MKRLANHVKTAVTQGFFLTLPLLFIGLFIEWIFSIFSKLGYPFLTFSAFLLLSYLSGLFLISKFAQKKELNYLILSQIPIIGRVLKFISASKSIFESFKFPILIQHPRLNCWAIGFIMGDKTTVLNNKEQEADTLIRVLVFTAHLTAQNCWFSKNEEVSIGISRNQAIEAIVSFGFLGKKENITLKKKTLGEVFNEINLD